MRRYNSGVLLLLAVLLTGITFQVPAESANNTSYSGVIIAADSLKVNHSDSQDDALSQLFHISVVDVLPLLNNSRQVDVQTPDLVKFITIGPNEALGTQRIQQRAYVLYIISGSAEITADDAAINASEGDAVLVPASSEIWAKNTGVGNLSAISLVSSGNTENVSNLTLMKRSLDTKPPVTFGNVSTSDYFTVHRMYSTFEEALPLSFDLAVATIPAGNVIKDHYLESGQLGYVLSGTGNVTIGCVPHLISAGDLTYVPPGAVQSFAAEDTLQILLVTEPFYNPEKDHSSESLC